MTDLTPVFNELLKKHDARPTANPALSLENIDQFLKEAYRINAHIASLNTYLKGIRQPYLSNAPPPRRVNLSKSKQLQYLTDQQRDEIDAETKRFLRELNASIRNLADAEQIRQDTETTLRRKKYARLGLGSLGSWAAGGGAQSKSYEQSQEEEKANGINAHRESVLWYLRKKLQECMSLQESMMKKRLQRIVEQSRSGLANAEMRGLSDFVDFDSIPTKPAPKQKSHALTPAQMESRELYPEEQLTEQQVQMFEQENQDMLKHYQDTLDQVKSAEKSLFEIAELQTQLVTNLAVQSEHIDMLVAESYVTTDNVGGGNQQLKKASERKSTAKYVFYASCSLSLFLVAWDLII
ncbi:T-snare protein-3 [Coleophoma cylindrospora]|uniref:T-snare protein-3 n=1 Tax=Coleophoma cylindrospora TaxID=1849047 RepID=A0A3D8R6M0_9HELO|nr:T-snare protein-3 [Coleophoma cylindrospora]